MKLCFMCDLHLPFDENALQYRVLDWAVKNIQKSGTDCVIFAGDVTCDGNIDVYKSFIKRMQSINIPFLFIPGNSDLRCKESREEISKISSACKNEIDGRLIFAVNDCKGEILDEQLELLEGAQESSIVFMHHPEYIFSKPCREKLGNWRKNHPETKLFYGHRHISKIDNNDISLQAIDPDKAIGEEPCISYYDTETGVLTKAYFSACVPEDLRGYFGISCYKIFENIDFAIQNRLNNLELRKDCIKADENKLVCYIDLWRKNGGKNLSIHLPDVEFINGQVILDENIDKYIELAKLLKVDRFTQHVPKVSVKTVREDGSAFKKICHVLAEKYNRVSNVIIGVENMHITANDTPDGNRRYGYIPEECLEFMEMLSEECENKVGINFDIGHARNNSPYSQKYQISTWFSMLGRHIIGYHIHQVTNQNGVFYNHMPISNIYGNLISYASFFASWRAGQINKAPVVFEMRPEDAYEITLATFDPYFG